MKITNKQVEQLARDIKAEVLERFETNDYIELGLLIDSDGTIGYCNTTEITRLVYDGFKHINTLKIYKADDKKITIKSLGNELKELYK